MRMILIPPSLSALPSRRVAQTREVEDFDVSRSGGQLIVEQIHSANWIIRSYFDDAAIEVPDRRDY